MMSARIYPIENTSDKLYKIGFIENELYLSPNTPKSIEIWSINIFIPNSLKTIIYIPIEERFYTFFATKKSEELIYILAIASFEDVPQIAIIEVNISNKSIQMYNLDESCGNEFENSVYIDNIVLRFGGTRLFMYDGSIVSGPIPFWYITLRNDSMTFVIENETINDNYEDNGGIQCSRFPVFLDSDKRFMRICDDHRVLIYDDRMKRWNRYQPVISSSLELSGLHSRGIRETYGRRGRRMGAVESPLRIYSDNDICIAMVRQNNSNSFYSVQFDHIKLEYAITTLTKCELSDTVLRKFYGICSPTQFIFVYKDGIAILPFTPPTLKELSFLSIQKYCSTVTSNQWSGGISEDEIKKLCSYKAEKSLLI